MSTYTTEIIDVLVEKHAGKYELAKVDLNVLINHSNPWDWANLKKAESGERDSFVVRKSDSRQDVCRNIGAVEKNYLNYKCILNAKGVYSNPVRYERITNCPNEVENMYFGNDLLSKKEIKAPKIITEIIPPLWRDAPFVSSYDQTTVDRLHVDKVISITNSGSKYTIKFIQVDKAKKDLHYYQKEQDSRDDKTQIDSITINVDTKNGTCETHEIIMGGKPYDFSPEKIKETLKSFYEDVANHEIAAEKQRKEYQEKIKEFFPRDLWDSLSEKTKEFLLNSKNEKYFWFENVASNKERQKITIGLNDVYSLNRNKNSEYNEHAKAVLETAVELFKEKGDAVTLAKEPRFLKAWYSTTLDVLKKAFPHKNLLNEIEFNHEGKLCFNAGDEKIPINCGSQNYSSNPALANEVVDQVQKLDIIYKKFLDLKKIPKFILENNIVETLKNSREQPNRLTINTVSIGFRDEFSKCFFIKSSSIDDFAINAAQLYFRLYLKNYGKINAREFFLELSHEKLKNFILDNELNIKIIYSGESDPLNHEKNTVVFNSNSETLTFFGSDSNRVLSFEDFYDEMEVETFIKACLPAVETLVKDDPRATRAAPLAAETQKESILTTEGKVTNTMAAKTMQEKMIDIAKSDAQETAKRLAVIKMSKIIQDALVKALTQDLKGKKKSDTMKAFHEFFATEKGMAVIQVIAGIGLPAVRKYVPQKYHAYLDITSKEMRIQGETTAVLSAIDTVEPLIKMLTGGIMDSFNSSGAELVRIETDAPATTEKTEGQEAQVFEFSQAANADKKTV